MANPNNPHDKFFRSSMQNATVAELFLQRFLPEKLAHRLDFKAMILENSSYIDETLRETISDLVFTCPYIDSDDEHEGEDANVVILVEHQSVPDKLMPFRVFHYLFNMLHLRLKRRRAEQRRYKLPAVYVLVFYHGIPSPYPYSMKLMDCFYDPLKVMGDLLVNPVPLVDVNQVPDDDIKQQKLLGIVTGALKYCRQRDLTTHLSWQTSLLNLLDLADPLQLNLLRTFWHYMLLLYPSDLKMQIQWV